jgi:hypothetical protein
LFVSVVVGFFVLAGFSDDVKKIVDPENFKVGTIPFRQRAVVV